MTFCEKVEITCITCNKNCENGYVPIWLGNQCDRCNLRIMDSYLNFVNGQDMESKDNECFTTSGFESSPFYIVCPYCDVKMDDRNLVHGKKCPLRDYKM